MRPCRIGCASAALAGAALLPVASQLSCTSYKPTAREIVDICRGHVRQCAEIDIARCLAARALDFQPGEAAVDGLIDCRARIDGTAVAPHTFVPRLAGEVVGFPDQPVALATLFRRPD